MNWETLLSIGDSITYGARSYAGYPEYAGAELSKYLSKDWNIINESVSGYKTIDISRLISKDFNNLKSQAPSIITIMSGTNDVKNGIEPETFSIAYSQLISKAKILTPNVILLNLPYFTKGIMYPYNFSMNDLIKIYNEKIENLAKKHGVRFYKLSYSEDYFFDGVHLNEYGCKKIGTELSNLILADKGILKEC